MKSVTCLVACLVQFLVLPSLALTIEFLQPDHALAAEQPAVKPPKPMFGPEAGDPHPNFTGIRVAYGGLKIGYPWDPIKRERERERQRTPLNPLVN